MYQANLFLQKLHFFFKGNYNSQRSCIHLKNTHFLSTKINYYIKTNTSLKPNHKRGLQNNMQSQSANQNFFWLCRPCNFKQPKFNQHQFYFQAISRLQQFDPTNKKARAQLDWIQQKFRSSKETILGINWKIKNKGHLCAKGFYWRAFLLTEQNKLDQAIGHCSISIQIDSFCAPSYNLLGYLASKKQFEPVVLLIYFLKAAKLNPVYYYANLEYALIKMGNFDISYAVIESMRQWKITTVQDQLAFIEYLGMLWQKTKFNEQAIKAFQKYLQLKPNAKEIEVKLQQLKQIK